MIDINNLIAQLRQVEPQFLKDCCIVNGNVWPLNQIENMSLEEYAARTIYSLPMKFYKYFPNVEKEEKDDAGNKRFRNYSTMALESNEVFLSSPSAFDDVFDSEIYVSWEEFETFRIKTFARWSKCCFDENMSTEEIANIFLGHLNGIIQTDKDLETAFDMEGYGELEKLQAQGAILRLKIEITKNHLGVALRNIIIQEYDAFIKELQLKFRVACFTTTPVSQLMWGASYANEHKGFCLEYTVTLDKEYEEIIHNIRPVVYCKTRRPVTQAILNAYNKNWDLSALRDLYLNGVLRKSIDWAYQNEWRLLLPPQEHGQSGFTKKFFPITKVYLGNRMPPKGRKEIIDICKRKGIPYVGVTRSPDLFEMQECNILCENCLRYNSN